MTESTTTTPPIRADYPDPLWVQAAELIRDEISSGRLKPGMRLPPERELCQRLSISRVTLRKALATLVDEGALSPSHGRGWYVAGPGTTREWPQALESFTETATRMGLVATSEVLKAGTEPASIDVAEQLAVAPGIPVFCLERVRLLGGVPVALDRTRIPISLAPSAEQADYTTASLFAVLEGQGVRPRRAEATIEALGADDTTAGYLGIEPGAPLLLMRQVALDDENRPLFLSTIRYAGERYRLRTSFLRS